MSVINATYHQRIQSDPVMLDAYKKQFNQPPKFDTEDVTPEEEEWAKAYQPPVVVSVPTEQVVSLPPVVAPIVSIKPTVENYTPRPVIIVPTHPYYPTILHTVDFQSVLHDCRRVIRLLRSPEEGIKK
jgi:hypothetical protein